MNRFATLLFRTWAGRGALAALAAFPFLLAPGALARVVGGSPDIPAVLAPPPPAILIYAGIGLAVASVLMFITQWLVDERRIWIAAAGMIFAVAALAPAVHG